MSKELVIALQSPFNQNASHTDNTLSHMWNSHRHTDALNAFPFKAEYFQKNFFLMSSMKRINLIQKFVALFIIDFGKHC